MNRLPLCDIIDNLKTPTDIICEGKAYSMALYILMSGRNNPNVRRFSYAGSSGLLHAGSEQVSGNVHDVRDTIKFYDKTEELVKNRIIANSNLTLDFLKSIEREQFFMYGKEMLEYGFIDEIIGPSTYLRPTTRRTTRRTINQRSGKYHRKKNI